MREDSLLDILTATSATGLSAYFSRELCY